MDLVSINYQIEIQRTGSVRVRRSSPAQPVLYRSQDPVLQVSWRPTGQQAPNSVEEARLLRTFQRPSSVERRHRSYGYFRVQPLECSRDVRFRFDVRTHGDVCDHWAVASVVHRKRDISTATLRVNRRAPGLSRVTSTRSTLGSSNPRSAIACARRSIRRN